MRVILSKSAIQAIARSPKRDLIRKKIDELATDPLMNGPNIKRMKGSDGYRLRVQDWRVVFRIDGDILIVSAVGPRGRIYRE
jgi:mRNA interferase RelE/StbE